MVEAFGSSLILETELTILLQPSCAKNPLSASFILANAFLTHLQSSLAVLLPRQSFDVFTLDNLECSLGLDIARQESPNLCKGIAPT